ncbi:sigma-70 family RNA polymerase sigma factor [Paenibacillus sp. SN-8-1]|uniref:sigma-70 family RNA polymerase sigma factor n=1 Tax=Paenibacillus sp. SN-8-1 TaxID=3435409 RepID=UPI003D9A7CA1
MTHESARNFPDNPLLGPLSRADFISANIPLVHDVARRFREACRNQHVDYADIISEGSIGLIDAYDRFNDATKSFAAFAGPYIRGYMQNYFRDKVGDIRIPWRQMETARAVSEAQLTESSTGEIAETLGITRKAADKAVILARLRYTTPVDNADGSSRPFAIEDDVTRVDVETYVTGLSERDRFIARRLMDGVSMRQISEEIGVSPSMVAYLVGKLRKSCAAEFGVAA